MNLKLPKKPGKPALKTNLKMPSFLGNVKMPRFLGDLFSDLRDRRLLPLVAVLAIAIVAVPFALSKSSSSPGKSPSAGAVTPAEGGSPTLAVVAGDPGLRDYRERLDGEDARNPFIQHFTTPVLAGGELGGPTTEIGGGGDSTDTLGEPSGPTTGVGSDSGETDSTDTGEDAGEESEPGTEPSPDTEPSEPEPAYVVALRAGAPGDVKPLELSAPQALPSTENPIVVFRGLSENGHKAVFRVSPSVTAIFGDAKCLAGTDRCELVEVEPGLPVNFVYGAADKVYRVTVVDIEHNR